MRGVLPLDWDRRHWTTPGETTSQEAWPGPEPLGPTSLWLEPRVERRQVGARSNVRVAASEKMRKVLPGLAGVLLPFFAEASKGKP